MKNKGSCMMQLAAAMTIYGSLGLLRRNLPVSSGMIALARGVIGCLFLMLWQRCRGQKPDWALIRKNLGMLILSGIILGLGWIALFEAYRYTAVATATLCYYTAPILVVLASVRMLGEKMTQRKWICVGVAAFGMVLASGALDSTLSRRDLMGVGIGLLAAALYAAMILLNQKLKAISGFDRAIVQLGTSAVILLPYNLITMQGSLTDLGGSTLILLLAAGVIHTGIAYGLYFNAMSGLSAQTVALMSYLDPIVALLLSGLVLHESIGTTGILGAVLVLGSTVVSELPPLPLPHIKSRDYLRFPVKNAVK